MYDNASLISHNWQSGLLKTSQPHMEASNLRHHLSILLRLLNAGSRILLVIAIHRRLRLKTWNQLMMDLKLKLSHFFFSLSDFHFIDGKSPGLRKCGAWHE